MTLNHALHHLVERFPFQDYVNLTTGAHLNVAHTVMRHLLPGEKVLDFGCGPCDKTALLQYLGFECSGYDDLKDSWHQVGTNRDRILSFAKESGIDFQLAEDGPLPFSKGEFDMVMLHDVIEHLHDSPRELLNDLLELVKPQGLLFITVPNAANLRKRINVLFGRTNLPRFEWYYWPPGPWRGHVREYVKNDLVKLSQYLGVDIVELRACDHMLQNLRPAMRTVYLGFTAVFSGLKDSWTLVARKPQNWTPRKTLPTEELARIPGTRESGPAQVPEPLAITAQAHAGQI